MNFKHKILSILNFQKTILPPTGDESKTPEPIKALKQNFMPTQLFRTRQDIGRWRTSLISAENIYNPQRKRLYEIYNDALIDSHLSAIINSRKKKTLFKEFKIVDKNNNEVQEKTKLLQSTWFLDFLDLALDSIFWGHSLIQFNDIIDNNFSSVELIERQHVKPEFNIVVNNYSDVTGINFNDAPYSDWLIPVGKKKDLGLLMKASPLILYKRNAIAAYAEHCEVFGTPLRVAKTSVRDEELRKNAFEMMQNLASSTFAVMDKEDTIEFISSQSSNGGEIYETLIRLIDEQISKLIFGQTMSSDNGSSKSQAEVHENVSEEYSQADMKFIEFLVNDKLIPFLNLHNFGFENLSFCYDYNEYLSIEEQFKIDAELLKFYEIPDEYITKKYGTPVSKRVTPIENNSKSGATSNTSVLNFL